MSKDDRSERFKEVCHHAEELAGAIASMRACSCHGTGVKVSIVDGNFHTELCHCSIVANEAIDKWRKAHAEFCMPDKNPEGGGCADA